MTLKEWRLGQHLTQAKAAKYLGVHPETFGAWERGRQRIPWVVRTLLRLDDPEAEQAT